MRVKEINNLFAAELEELVKARELARFVEIDLENAHLQLRQAREAIESGQQKLDKANERVGVARGRLCVSAMAAGAVEVRVAERDSRDSSSGIFRLSKYRLINNRLVELIAVDAEGYGNEAWKILFDFHCSTSVPDYVKKENNIGRLSLPECLKKMIEIGWLNVGRITNAPLDDELVVAYGEVFVYDFERNEYVKIGLPEHSVE